MTNALLREFSGPLGPLEAILDEPVGPPRALCAFAHPHPLHGGSMHSKPVFHASKALARIGVLSLRFNFRGVGRSHGKHDGGPGELADYRAALDFLSATHPGVPLWAAGFSFGAWVAWSVGLDDLRVSLLLGVGLPVNLFDFSPFYSSVTPKVIVHGELDQLVPSREIRKFYGALSEPKELVVIDGADHVFDGQTTELGEAIEDLLLEI